MQAIKIIIPDENIPEHKREVTPTFTIGKKGSNPSKSNYTSKSLKKKGITIFP